MGERLRRTQEVGSSTLLVSTTMRRILLVAGFDEKPVDMSADMVHTVSRL